LRCRLLECVAGRCRVPLKVGVHRRAPLHSALQCAAVRCTAVRGGAERCGALQCVVGRCSALECVTVRCSALQCFEVRAARWMQGVGACWIVWAIQGIHVLIWRCTVDILYMYIYICTYTVDMYIYIRTYTGLWSDARYISKNLYTLSSHSHRPHVRTSPCPWS